MEDLALVETMKRIAPGFYTERDGGRWYVLTPEHDRIAEEFSNRENARRLVCWFAGEPMPDGWKVSPHGDGRISYDLEIPGQYSPATIWTRETVKAFPQLATTFKREG